MDGLSRLSRRVLWAVTRAWNMSPPVSSIAFPNTWPMVMELYCLVPARASWNWSVIHLSRFFPFTVHTAPPAKHSSVFGGSRPRPQFTEPEPYAVASCPGDHVWFLIDCNTEKCVT